MEELFLMELNIDAKFERKMTCTFKNDMRNLAHFHREHVQKSKNWDLWGSLSKVEHLWA